MGFGQARRADRCLKAAKMALKSPLIAGKSLNWVKYLLINLKAPKNFMATEFLDLNEYLISQINPQVQFFSALTYHQAGQPWSLVKVSLILSASLREPAQAQI
ncbi:MAG: hypothetical protein LBE80_03145 [Deltaproteobacteria bacterium]|jgi:cell division GTPase FtsZ|nr:hypothetical protein [Deltaproteobacteria bacterium]